VADAPASRSVLLPSHFSYPSLDRFSLIVLHLALKLLCDAPASFFPLRLFSFPFSFFSAFLTLNRRSSTDAQTSRRFVIRCRHLPFLSPSSFPFFPPLRPASGVYIRVHCARCERLHQVPSASFSSSLPLSLFPFFSPFGLLARQYHQVEHMSERLASSMAIMPFPPLSLSPLPPS